jgi:hypothetical protein
MVSATKEIANGTTARVVRDTVYRSDEIVEDTFDWYAQDAAGVIWYLGEDTTELEDGAITSREGSFEVGVDGALPGIAVPAQPEPGMRYRQEYYAGQAEDNGEVLEDPSAEIVVNSDRTELSVRTHIGRFTGEYFGVSGPGRRISCSVGSPRPGRGSCGWPTSPTSRRGAGRVRRVRHRRVLTPNRRLECRRRQLQCDQVEPEWQSRRGPLVVLDALDRPAGGRGGRTHH